MCNNLLQNVQKCVTYCAQAVYYKMWQIIKNVGAITQWSLCNEEMNFVEL